MKKKVVSCLLAAAMVVSSGAAVPGFFFTPEKVQAEENDTKAEKENLALKGTAAASEAEADSTSAAKAIDGNKGTHWGTSQNKVTNEWIEVTLEKPTKVSEIKVFWERTGAAGNHQNNIKQWKVDVKTMSGEYKNIYQKTDEDTYAPSEQTITVAEDAQEKESTGIGLKTCAKIIGDHGGSFYSGREAGFFLTKISLPLIIS